MYRIEHLSFVSNMEAQFAGWLEQPWHIIYSPLRCMTCQDWRYQHLCPICRNTHRNSSGTHDAWAYFHGCISHLTTTPRCIGSFMVEDTVKGRGKPLTPSLMSLLQTLSPKQGAREYWLPMLSIIYVAPGGHRQWPMSITALLDRLSWIVHQTRPLALSYFQEVVQKDPTWKPKYQCGPRTALAPSIPYKFLDVGTKMGCYKLREHIPMKDDTDNIYHPRFISDAIPPVNTFHAVAHDRASRGWVQDADEWCLEEAWFDHSPTFDFRVNDPPGCIWGLPVLVPTCPKKLWTKAEVR